MEQLWPHYQGIEFHPTKYKKTHKNMIQEESELE
jgi:hypothetical protein